MAGAAAVETGDPPTEHIGREDWDWDVGGSIWKYGEVGCERMEIL